MQNEESIILLVSSDDNWGVQFDDLLDLCDQITIHSDKEGFVMFNGSFSLKDCLISLSPQLKLVPEECMSQLQGIFLERLSLSFPHLTQAF